MKPLLIYLNESLNDHITGDWIFTIIKPGFLKYTQDIMSIFENAGWELSQTTVKNLTSDEAQSLYKVHKDKDFYQGLCDYMSSGLSRAIIYTRPGQVSDKTFKDVNRLKDIIRDRWGVDDCKNVMHSSDSLSAMEHESSIYF